MLEVASVSRRKRWAVLLLGVGLAWADAAAWGPATHMYLLRVACPEATPEMYLAGALPDPYAMAPGPKPMKGRVKHLTHYDPCRMPASPFAAAFASHNGDWGADAFAHAYHYRPDEPGFMTESIRRFSEATGLDQHEAEDHVEAIVELVVGDAWGDALGPLLVSGADALTLEHREALVDAYAAPLAEGLEGLDPVRVEMTLRSAIEGYCGLLRVYGKYLSMPKEDIARTAPKLLAAAFGIPERVARARVKLVMDDAEEWTAELKRLGEELRKRLESKGLPLEEVGLSN